MKGKRRKNRIAVALRYGIPPTLALMKQVVIYFALKWICCRLSGENGLGWAAARLFGVLWAPADKLDGNERYRITC